MKDLEGAPGAKPKPKTAKSQLKEALPRQEPPQSSLMDCSKIEAGVKNAKSGAGTRGFFGTSVPKS